MKQTEMHKKSIDWYYFLKGRHRPAYLKITSITTGEGNGNPLQYSCLENPRGRGAWWAAVYGVAQSQTRLKRLSSSSSHTWLEALVLDSRALALHSHPHHGSPEWQFLLGGRCHALLWKPKALDQSHGSVCTVTATHGCQADLCPIPALLFSGQQRSCQFHFLRLLCPTYKR